MMVALLKWLSRKWLARRVWWGSQTSLGTDLAWMRNNPKQCPRQASCHELTALLGFLVLGPLTPGIQASSWPEASVGLVQNKESTVAQPGFSRRYLVGHNERKPEPQGWDYKAALATNFARNKALLATASPLLGISMNTSQAYVPVDCRAVWAKKGIWMEDCLALNQSAWHRWAAIFTDSLVYRKMKQL